MTFAKRLLLGSAAAMLVVGGAQAADLPLAEPVEYVKVCNTYGEGFFYIPGSDTCLQIAGYVRAETYAFDGDAGGRFFRRQDGPSDNTAFSAEATVDFDARTETEYGTLRSYIRLKFTRESGGPGETASAADSDLIEHAFVQFAGLTAGRTTSFYDFYANENLFGEIAGSDIETQLLAYTATFGTGFTATIALEDATERRQNPGIFGVSNYGEQEWPDVVANLRVEQGWGAAQISGALHNANTPDGKDKTGYAVQAGVSFNLPFLGEEDTLILQAAYADGAIAYLGAGKGYNGFFEDFNTADDFDNNFGRTDKSQGFAASAELLHYWSENLRSVFAASYADIDDARLGADYREWIGVGSLVWSPVKKLDIGVEVGYTNLDYKSKNNDRELGYDTFTGILRVERSF